MTFRALFALILTTSISATAHGQTTPPPDPPAKVAPTESGVTLRDVTPLLVSMGVAVPTAALLSAGGSLASSQPVWGRWAGPATALTMTPLAVAGGTALAEMVAPIPDDGTGRVIASSLVSLTSVMAMETVLLASAFAQMANDMGAGKEVSFSTSDTTNEVGTIANAGVHGAVGAFGAVIGAGTYLLLRAPAEAAAEHE